MARQRAVFIASTGYGLGDDIGLAGTELLLTVFADELVQGDVFIGNALRDSKESFLLSLLSMTTYDEKSSIQLTMFGLPMYKVKVPSTPGSITPLPAVSNSPELYAERAGRCFDHDDEPQHRAGKHRKRHLPDRRR